MLSAEKECFLKILSDFVNNRKSDYIFNTTDPEHINVDLDLLLSYARQQQMEGIIYFQTKLPPLQSFYASTVILFPKRRKMLADVDAAFTSIGIPYIILKGTEAAQFYPRPQLRTMGDTDLLVHPEDKVRAGEALEKLGFSSEHKDTVGITGDFEWKYIRDGLEIELHHKLLYNEPAYTDKDKAFGETVWNYAHKQKNSGRYILDWSYHFTYLLLHLKKHMINYGAGFRQFMDLAFMVSQTDREWTDRVLKELDLDEFARNCLAFCRRWFEIELPGDAQILEEDFYIWATEQIFANGVFGFDDAKNFDNSILYQMNDGKNSEDKKTVATQKFRTALRIVLPTRKELSSRTQYAYLNDHPYLLPWVWTERILRSVITGRSFDGIRTVRKSLDMSEERIQRRIEYLKNWGL